MPEAKYSPSLQVGGVSMQKNVTRTGDHPNAYEVTLPIAWAVSSWVKTDANTAAGNLTTGHGQTSGTYDVFWSGGRRYGVAATITVDAIALDGGTGDDFPATANTTVTVSKQVVINSAIDGDNIEIIGLCVEIVDDELATSKGHVTFKDADGDTILAIDLTANSPVIYDVAAGVDNPFTGDPITIAYASNGNAEFAAVLKLASLEDSTP